VRTGKGGGGPLTYDGNLPKPPPKKGGCLDAEMHNGKENSVYREANGDDAGKGET